MPVYKSKKPTKDGRAWYYKISYKDDYGNYKNKYSKYYLTKREAQEEEAKAIIENDTTANNFKTINDLYKEYYIYQSSRLKPSSLYTLEKCFVVILPIIGNKKLPDLTVKQIENFKSKLNGSNGYKNKLLKTLRALNNYNYKMNGIRNDAFDKIDNFKVDKKEMLFYTLEEFEKFIKKVEGNNYKALFTTLFFSGLRIGEALALTWNDMKNNKIKINKNLSNKVGIGTYTITTPKNESSNRTLPMPKQVKKALILWYNEISTYDGFRDSFFVFNFESPLNLTSVTKVKNKASKDAKLKQIRIHDFRHSTASLLINNNANITLVSKYLGHSNVTQTLNTYSHFYQSELNKLMDKINNL